MKLIAVILVVATGCAGSFGKVNRHVGRAALITSTLTLICDGMQTLRMAGEGWTNRRWEGGPLGAMAGIHPTVAEVGIYFVGAVVINAAAWVVTPERYRSPLPVAVTAVQTKQVIENASRDTGVCGI